jgi:ribosome biogenesis GTPase / thiamine phosphate phosphatase
MKKKQLSQRQHSRIELIQQRRTERAARKTEKAIMSAGQLGPEQSGLVITHFGQQLDIEALEGEHQGEIFRCHQRTNLEPLVTGDRVIWQQGDPYGVVVAGLARKTLLTRPSGGQEPKPVAANIDTLVIVIAPYPEPHSNLIDRYLVAAHHIRVQPLIVINKYDLLNDDNRAHIDDLSRLYRSIGYRVLGVSAHSGEGMSELKALLDTRTSIVAGQSGVGKSALVNSLMPGVDTLEGSLSYGVDKGRHTTTAARLFHFPEGGDLIDSPGIREFGLEHLPDQSVIEGFVDFHPFLGHCRFRDCRHEQEPGCRLLAALDNGEIDWRRLESYRLILATSQQVLS